LKHSKRKVGRPPLENKSHTTFVRIPHEVYEIVKSKADRDEESVSSLILKAIKSYLGIGD